MYHRQVTSRPCRVPAIRSSSDPPPSPAASKIRLPVPGVGGSPDSPAVHLVCDRALSTPLSIQLTGGMARPLSNTDASRVEVRAITNVAHRSPAAPGSLRSVTGRLDSRSPTRVPPPGRLNTVRPSSASLAPADQYR